MDQRKYICNKRDVCSLLHALSLTARHVSQKALLPFCKGRGAKAGLYKLA
jgi:hypothetical protein